MMKRNAVWFMSLLASLLMASSVGQAQFNNSWIDYNKTYYKFKVGQDGLYRVPKATLQSIGLEGTPVEQFQLWRNGQEVPLFTSIPTGILGDSDFLEFYGQMNDGKPDAVMYKNPSFQLSDKWSLQTDTAAYFLTVNPGIANARITAVSNNIAGNTLPAEPFFMHTMERHFRDQINAGFASVVGVYVYSSSYDNGEGWSSRNILPATPLVEQYNNLFVAPGGPDPVFRIAAFGNAPNARTLRINVNGTTILERRMDFFNSAIQEVGFAANLLGRQVDTIRVTDLSGVATDRLTLGKYEMVYPRQFNFGGSPFFSFALPSSNNGNYLEIAAFATDGVAPVLYETTGRQRFVGDISTPGVVKFSLPAGGNRQFVLMNAGGQLKSVTALAKRNFTDFTATALQGDFLIITHPSLLLSNAGDPIAQYKSYRESQPGGSHQVAIFYTDDLEDQFAFGIKKHPLSIKQFIAWARQRFQVTPKNVLLIGKGVTYDQYRLNESRSASERINLVPTFGNPGSDNILASDDNDPTPDIPIGRLSVTNGDEILAYLDKVKQHDQALRSPVQTIADKGWMKNVAHVIGGGDPYLQGVINGYMSTAKKIISDTVFGANVYTFEKLTPTGIEQINSGLLGNLFNEGLGMITYFGHSSASSMEFNLDDPAIFKNDGKYPLFLANGCNAGNFFIYDTLRLNAGKRSISENYILTPNKGSIGFLASTHYGIVNYLNLYTYSLYSKLASQDYSATIGNLQKNALREVMNRGGAADYYNIITMEQSLLNGDPAVQLYPHPMPDYVVEEATVLVSPTPVSLTDSKFDLRIKLVNIGRASTDSVPLKVVHDLPDGSSQVLFDAKFARLFFADSISIAVPVVPNKFKGQHKITVIIDEGQQVPEITKSNNSLTRTFIINEDAIRPVSPFPFAIVNTSTVAFKTSIGKFTSNPLVYIIEVDSTELFSSPLKVSQTLSSSGGLLEFNPVVQLRDSMVYYWRVAQKPDTGTSYNWASSSFVYLPQSGKGWNQSHYYQHRTNIKKDIYYDEHRQLNFSRQNHLFRVNTGLLPSTSNNVYNDLTGLVPLTCAQAYGSFEMVMIDTRLAKPVKNNAVNNVGKYKSDFNAICSPLLPNMFWYSYNNAISRKNMMDMFDSIPAGTMVVMMNLGNSVSRFDNIAVWQSDTLLYGKGQSLYHKMKSLGFHLVDSLTRKLPFLFIGKKGAGNSWEVMEQQVGQQASSILKFAGEYGSQGVAGNDETDLIGPARSWNQIKWTGNSIDITNQDAVLHQVYGVGKNFAEQLLFETASLHVDTALQFIDANTFPYLKVRRLYRDTTWNTPWQPDYLQVDFESVPEGALLNLNLKQWTDSVDVGAPLKLNMSFKNISDAAFDSVRVWVGVVDEGNRTDIILDTKKRPLSPGDTIQLEYVLNTEKLKGQQAVLVNFNPELDQPEQYLFNNYLIKGFHVGADLTPPDLDVTFDGVRIINRDIVSARPEIMMTLKDDSKYMALNDTALFSIRLKYPDGTNRPVRFDNDTLQFMPAGDINTGNGNQAKVLFKPHLQQDGTYELSVRARDRSNNLSGALDYNVAFEVINKSMITNMLNYPNPFSTSTAFVFTLTGSVLPTHLRIQVLTITGKIVREITGAELGPLQIGHNITTYKWDGRDQYGQQLANGVYLYRVIAEINGTPIEKLNKEGFNTDRYFKSGYGKMYLMR
jgi:Peptidase family C25